jgi:PAS domain S-box-containing protein
MEMSVDLGGSSLTGVLLEVMLDSAIITDLRGAVLVFNPAAEILTGYTILQAQAMNIQDFCADVEATRRVLKQEERNIQLAIRTVENDRIPVRMLIRPLKDELGDATGILYILRDMRPELGAAGGVAELIRLERQISRLKRRINNLQSLSQPLAVATGVTDILLETPGTSPITLGRLEQLARSLQRLGEGLSELTELLRVDTDMGSDT